MLNEAEDAEHFLVVLSHRGSASLCVCVWRGSGARQEAADICVNT